MASGVRGGKRSLKMTRLLLDDPLFMAKADLAPPPLPIGLGINRQRRIGKGGRGSGVQGRRKKRTQESSSFSTRGGGSGAAGKESKWKEENEGVQSPAVSSGARNIKRNDRRADNSRVDDENDSWSSEEEEDDDLTVYRQGKGSKHGEIGTAENSNNPEIKQRRVGENQPAFFNKKGRFSARKNGGAPWAHNIDHVGICLKQGEEMEVLLREQYTSYLSRCGTNNNNNKNNKYRDNKGCSQNTNTSNTKRKWCSNSGGIIVKVRGGDMSIADRDELLSKYNIIQRKGGRGETTSVSGEAMPIATTTTNDEITETLLAKATRDLLEEQKMRQKGGLALWRYLSQKRKREFENGETHHLIDTENDADVAENDRRRSSSSRFVLLEYPRMPRKKKPVGKTLRQNPNFAPRINASVWKGKGQLISPFRKEVVGDGNFVGPSSSAPSQRVVSSSSSPYNAISVEKRNLLQMCGGVVAGDSGRFGGGPSVIGKRVQGGSWGKPAGEIISSNVACTATTTTEPSNIQQAVNPRGRRFLVAGTGRLNSAPADALGIAQSVRISHYPSHSLLMAQDGSVPITINNNNSNNNMSDVSKVVPCPRPPPSSSLRPPSSGRRPQSAAVELGGGGLYSHAPLPMIETAGASKTRSSAPLLLFKGEESNAAFSPPPHVHTTTTTTNAVGSVSNQQNTSRRQRPATATPTTTNTKKAARVQTLTTQQTYGNTMGASAAILHPEGVDVGPLIWRRKQPITIEGEEGAGAAAAESSKTNMGVKRAAAEVTATLFTSKFSEFIPTTLEAEGILPEFAYVDASSGMNTYDNKKNKKFINKEGEEHVSASKSRSNNNNSMCHPPSPRGLSSKSTSLAGSLVVAVPAQPTFGRPSNTYEVGGAAPPPRSFIAQSRKAERERIDRAKFEQHLKNVAMRSASNRHPVRKLSDFEERKQQQQMSEHEHAQKREFAKREGKQGKQVEKINLGVRDREPAGYSSTGHQCLPSPRLPPKPVAFGLSKAEWNAVVDKKIKEEERRLRKEVEAAAIANGVDNNGNNHHYRVQDLRKSHHEQPSCPIVPRPPLFVVNESWLQKNKPAAATAVGAAYGLANPMKGKSVVEEDDYRDRHPQTVVRSGSARDGHHRRPDSYNEGASGSNTRRRSGASPPPSLSPRRRVMSADVKNRIKALGESFLDH